MILIFHLQRIFGFQKSEEISTATISVEPRAPRGPRPFQKGDDVLFTTDDGTFMFGTVGMVLRD
jgi:hypothetical protein